MQTKLHQFQQQEWELRLQLRTEKRLQICIYIQWLRAMPISPSSRHQYKFKCDGWFPCNLIIILHYQLNIKLIFLKHFCNILLLFLLTSEKGRIINLNHMNSDVQNFTQDKVNSNGNLLIEISMTIMFVSIIIFSCMVLFGS